MRRIAFPLLIALALVTAACGGGNGGGNGGDAGADCVDLTTQGDTFTIRLSGNEFVPSCFTASASQSLRLVNDDGGLHSFTVEGTPIDVDISGNDELLLDPVTGQVEPGTYELICKYHLPGMSGEITVVA
jgi:plastocyanin